MDSKQDPYKALCELFPQVDARIIRACVLDHGDDLKSSIDFLGNEVLAYNLEGCNSVYQRTDVSPLISTVSTAKSIQKSKGIENLSTSLKRDTLDPTKIECNSHEESIVSLSEIETSCTSDLSLIGKDLSDNVTALHLDELAQISTSLIDQEVCTSLHIEKVEEMACPSERGTSIAVIHDQVSEQEFYNSYLNFYAAEQKCSVPISSTLNSYSSTGSLRSNHTVSAEKFDDPHPLEQSIIAACDSVHPQRVCSLHCCASLPVHDEFYETTEVVKQHLEDKSYSLRLNQNVTTKITDESELPGKCIAASSCDSTHSGRGYTSSLAALQGNACLSSAGNASLSIHDDFYETTETVVEEDFGSLNRVTEKENFKDSLLLENSTIIMSCGYDCEQVNSGQGCTLPMAGLQSYVQPSAEAALSADAVLNNSIQSSHFEESSIHLIEHQKKEAVVCTSPFEDEAALALSISCGDDAACSTMSYNVNIGDLEESVEEAKGDNEFLKDKIKDLRLLWLKVDQEEAFAEQAKADASQGGFDILKKVEEMRQLLAKAREANEMHAGEVYGEKAVLATEAHELQLRLGQLSAEKEKTLNLLNKIQAALQTRFESATKEREVAEQEKREKEASAQMVLAMEEAVMTEVAQQSRDLDAEALACTRLREFLIDQGRIIDSLQGEMAVTCEDAANLKQQVEEGLLSIRSGYFSMPDFSQQVTHEGSQKLSSNKFNADSSRKLEGEMQVLVESSWHDIPVAAADGPGTIQGGGCGDGSFLLGGRILV